MESRFEASDGVISVLCSADHRLWIKALSEYIGKMKGQGITPVVLCSEAARGLVKDSTRWKFPDLIVLSGREIPADINVESIGEIHLANE